MTEQYKLYNTQDINTLRQKIETYKKTLEALKTGDAVEDYLLMKSEVHGIKAQVSQIEGVMKQMEENKDFHTDEYEQQVEHISAQIQTVNDSINHLKQDVTFLMNKMHDVNFNLLIEKMNSMLEFQKSSEENNEIDTLKEEIYQLKQTLHAKEQPQQQPPQQQPIPQQPMQANQGHYQPSSFRKLQNLIDSSNNIEYSANEKKNNLGGRRPQYNNPAPRSNPRPMMHDPINERKRGYQQPQDPRSQLNRNVMKSKRSSKVQFKNKDSADDQDERPLLPLTQNQTDHPHQEESPQMEPALHTPAKETESPTHQALPEQSKPIQSDAERSSYYGNKTQQQWISRKIEKNAEIKKEKKEEESQNENKDKKTQKNSLFSIFKW
ncbi:hypothetical protein [Thalassobacillus sp. CUG 92003]|uniref:hypothetical protein n=1 Tax=Thalassobacillus sp. CUG 92003 TaxID=2736641 RepID=UPI0015E70D04|nr:hypothetical protein [Thalassobacillus sp. CUG 92003]